MKYIVFVLLCQCVVINSMKGCLKPGERRLSFTELGQKYSFAVEEYSVTTDDDYILKLFHIPGEKKPPALLMHGFIDSADTFIIRGNKSLAVTLANAGYDVWIGNTRGNRYGRQHVYLNPDRDDGFWDFSFHEMGENDLPAIIDFILDKTKSKKLNAVAHSLGNTIFYILGAVLPGYNDKVNVLISVSPICFFSSLENAPALLMKATPTLSKLLQATGQEELLGDDTFLRRMYEQICGCDKHYRACSEGMFQFAGRDPEELEPKFFKTMILYYPTGSSRKTGVHMAQVGLRKSFSFYDYGSLNLDVYNSTDPPEYDLKKVTMKVALLFGNNDGLSTVEDVKNLRKNLPNVVEYFPIKWKKFNHVDAVWGRQMDKYLFPEIFRILERYGGV